MVFPTLICPIILVGVLLAIFFTKVSLGVSLWVIGLSGVLVVYDVGRLWLVLRDDQMNQ